MPHTSIEKVSQIILSQESDTSRISSTLKDGFEYGIKHYQSHYLWSLIDALKVKFKSVLALLEDDNFNFFSRKYILATPSQSENIDLYGEHFPSFLKNCPELSNVHFIESIASIDWYFYHENLNKKLKLPTGSLSVWQKALNNEPIGDKPSPNPIWEEIALFKKNKNFYLVANPLHLTKK